MLRITIIASVVAVSISGWAYYVGRSAANKADELTRYSAYLPPRNVPGPESIPPDAPQRVVTDLDDNPFSHRDSSGVLIPKDPKRRAAMETADAYMQLSTFAYAMCWIIPLLLAAGLFIARLRKRLCDTSETGEKSCDTAEPC